jgi:hypothetical protein
LRLLAFVGLAVALVGFGMLVAPVLTADALRYLGLRRERHPAERAAAWLLILLGLTMAIVARLIT